MATCNREDIPPEDCEWIESFPVPPPLPIRPFHALASVVKLILNKEDTRQVFEVIQAFSGRAAQRAFKRFVSTEYGRRVVAGPIRLEEILSNCEMLRALPSGSVGRAYLDFMEGENLTAEGLMNSAKDAGMDLQGETPFEAFQRLFLHLDISHDLWHVVTGYGRDALGELCNLCYTRVQTRNPGFRLIIWIVLLAVKLERWDLPLKRATDEARAMGENAEWILGFDVEELIALPLEEARRKLKIATPTVYNAIPAEAKARLLKPKVKKTQAEREARRLPA